MKTKTIAIFLSMMFATLTVAPDVVVLMDLGCDYSVVLDSGEDEERKKGEEKDRKNGEEKVNDFEIEKPSKFHFISSSFYTITHQLSNIHIDNYNSIVKELTSPPPELS